MVIMYIIYILFRLARVAVVPYTVVMLIPHTSTLAQLLTHTHIHTYTQHTYISREREREIWKKESFREREENIFLWV